MLRLSTLIGYALAAKDGEIGKVKEVYFDDQSWTVRYFVVQTGNWLLDRDVLISPGVVTEVDGENKCLSVALTQEKVKNSPPVESDKPVSRQYEDALLRYYEWERYWITETLVGVPKTTTKERSLRHPGVISDDQSHLHSSKEVCGYDILARDGEIGHVDDFILEPPDWTVRYLEIDTRNWLPGRHVLLAPAWVSNIDFPKSEVAVELSRESIQSAPAYDASKPISRDYQVELYKHYGMESGEK